MKQVSYSTASVLELLLTNKIGAFYQGKMEMGPRALGNRSIIADPRMSDGKDRVNEIKKREWYRPFACSILEEHAHNWFEMGRLKSSPYMSYAVPVKQNKWKEIPAVIHVDGTCRLQTVNKEQNPLYYNLIKEFYNETDVPLILNTSFNLAGMPMVSNLNSAFFTLNNSKLNFLCLPEINTLIIK